MRILFKIFLLSLLTGGMLQYPIVSQAQKNADASFGSELIFPQQVLHSHSSSVVELPNGDLLACWFQGSGERTANDVKVMGARRKKGENHWSTPFLMADTPGNPDCNPVLFLDGKNRLHLVWIVVVANRWETSILKTRISTDFQESGPPKWEWQDIILLKPGEEFHQAIEDGYRELNLPEPSWAEYAPPFQEMILKAAQDPVKRETGWMGRIHPLQLRNGRLLLPLYSDGYNLSLVAISDDNGDTWKPSLPIVAWGNTQPALIQKRDGSIVAYMRDEGNGPARVFFSNSVDHGESWSPAVKTDIPNGGASVDAIALKDGRWLMVYNDLEDSRNRLAVSMSEDEGESWPWKRYLEDSPKGKGSYSYPSMIQSPDGHVHITYSYHNSEGKSIRHVSFSPDWVKE